MFMRLPEGVIKSGHEDAGNIWWTNKGKRGANVWYPLEISFASIGLIGFSHWPLQF